jgi:hypothetical protein
MGDRATAIYKPGVRYKAYAGIGAVATVAFGWKLVTAWLGGQGVQWDALFFLVLMVGLMAWALWQIPARVETAPRSITLTRPFISPRTVEYRQLFSVTENGRVGGRSISLVYHPLRDDGLLDLDDARSLILPEVENQEALLELLESRKPV